MASQTNSSIGHGEIIYNCPQIPPNQVQKADIRLISNVCGCFTNRSILPQAFFLLASKNGMGKIRCFCCGASNIVCRVCYVSGEPDLVR